MTEEIKRLRRVCFTGHRPEKLNRSEKSVLDGLETAIRQAIADGSNQIIPVYGRFFVFTLFARTKQLGNVV